ncbi:MAG: hypothetical protein ACR2IH_01665 [Pyrinomonadaceae bacterium]
MEQHRPLRAKTPAPSQLDGLIRKLRAAGATVTKGSKVSQPFFTAAGRLLYVNGVEVQVFEYKATQKANADAGRVSPQGSPVSTSMVTWVAPPHFFKSGRLIVLYVGNEPRVLKALKASVGEQFAGK